MMFLLKIIFPLPDHQLYNAVQWCFSLTSSCYCLTSIYIICTMMIHPNTILSLSHHHLHNSYCTMMFLLNIILSLFDHHLYNIYCTMMFLLNIILSLSDHHLYNVSQWWFTLTPSCHCLTIIYIVFPMCLF